MKDDIRDWKETENEKERVVSYRTDRAFVTVHIPKHTPEEQAVKKAGVRPAKTARRRAVITHEAVCAYIGMPAP